MKNRFIAVAAAMGCVLLLIFSKPAVAAAANAAELWLKVLMPSLLPFLVCTALIQGACGSTLRSWQALVIGSVAGAPSGAALCAAALKSGGISVEEAQRLAPLANQSSPMFLTAAVGIGMLGSVQAGIILLLAQLVSTLACCALFGRGLFSRRKRASSAPKSITAVSAIDGGISIMLRVLCNVVLFSAAVAVTRSVLPSSFPQWALTFITGTLEMTVGCSLAATAPVRAALPICAFFTSFGGLCVFSQVRGILKVRAARYLAVKLVQGALAAVASYALSATYLRTSATFLPHINVGIRPELGWLAILGAAALSCAATALIAIPQKRKAPHRGAD